MFGLFGPRQRADYWDPWSDFFDFGSPFWGETPRQREQPRLQQRRPRADRPGQLATTSKAPCCPAGADKFRAKLDTAGFSPEEVNVKRSGNCVTVQARKDDGDISRSMFQQVWLPSDVKGEDLTARVDPSGQLVLEAPVVQPALEAPKDHEVPIQREAAAGAVEAAKEPAAAAVKDDGKPCEECGAGDVSAPDHKHVDVKHAKKSDTMYHVSADVAHFDPHEVSVKVNGNTVTVQAEHEENYGDHGFSSVRLLRSFTLPEGVNPDLVTSRLTPSGQLVIEAPRAQAAIQDKMEE